MEQKTTENKIIGEPTPASPDADTNKTSVFAISNIELPLHLPIPKSDGDPFSLVMLRVESKIVERTEIPLTVLAPDNTRQLNSAAIASVMAHRFEKALIHAGNAARNSIPIFQNLGRVKISIDASRSRADKNKKEKSLRSGFPLSEKNLDVLRGVRDRIPEKRAEYIARPFAAGHLVYSTAFVQKTDLVERIRENLRSLFAGRDLAAQIEQATRTTGYGAKRVHKLFKRARNADSRNGKTRSDVEIFSVICLDAIFKQAKRQIVQSNESFLRSYLLTGKFLQ